MFYLRETTTISAADFKLRLNYHFDEASTSYSLAQSAYFRLLPDGIGQFHIPGFVPIFAVTGESSFSSILIPDNDGISLRGGAHHCSGGTDDQAHPAPAPWAFLFGTVVAFLVRLI